MFFDTDHFSAEEIEVFKLTRPPYKRASQERPFHAISFRLCGSASYELSDGALTTGIGDILFVPAYAHYTKDTQAEQSVLIIYSLMKMVIHTFMVQHGAFNHFQKQ